MGFTIRKVTSTLKRHGYKLTPQRVAVIRAITSSQDHLTPTAIYRRVLQDHPKTGLATIYRTLTKLAQLGLICRLHTDDNCHSYTIGSSEHHHHLICSNCGIVVDFSKHDFNELEKILTSKTGFQIEDHLLEFTGLCQSCKKKPAITGVLTNQSLRKCLDE
jgi:Fur family ferric uptake transcriptional regulator